MWRARGSSKTPAERVELREDLRGPSTSTSAPSIAIRSVSHPRSSSAVRYAQRRNVRRHEEAMPLIMTRGWPGSIVELLETIGPLTDPTAHGGSPEDAFHEVLPSLPG